MVIDVAIKSASAFAPSNIALCKYWGKKPGKYNLPVNSSLSISLGDKGAFTKVSIVNSKQDQVFLNNDLVDIKSTFYIRIINFLDYFRRNLPQSNTSFKIETTVNLPIAAGLASSACGFAALIKALDKLFGWNATIKELSILARLGSGSACRSLFDGFVKWHAGIKEDGSDSFAEKLDVTWPELCVGLLITDEQPKYISSTAAMLSSVNTSPFYSSWYDLANKDLVNLELAINSLDFSLLGETAESNALAMHAIMLSARPAILYSNANTINNIQQIWRIRKDCNIPLYFTQDAGANLKLLFLTQDEATVRTFFPQLEIIKPFVKNNVATDR